MLFLLSGIFFVIAFIYASAGMGGGSAYLATMALLGVPKVLFPAVALSCNTVVASSSFYHYARNGFLRWPQVLPFLVASVPAAYLGGVIEVSDFWFRALLATSLGLSALFMILKKESFQRENTLNWKTIWWVALPIGTSLGLLAGVVGIGGGVFLIPILLFFGWASTKEAAAAGALFILVNSLAGLTGHWIAGRIEISWMWPTLLIVFIGGWLGGYVGSLKYSPVVVQKVFGGIILFVAWKIGRTLF